MIDLYYWTTPNGHKITIFLEEAGLPYSIKPVNISIGEQFAPGFLKVSPNNRIPAIVDNDPADGKEPLSVFESGAILQCLAEKTGKFLHSLWTGTAHNAVEFGLASQLVFAIRRRNVSVGRAKGEKRHAVD
jgi:glutathione S-transferase